MQRFTHRFCGRGKNYKQSEENISKAINEAVQKKIESEK